MKHEDSVETSPVIGKLSFPSMSYHATKDCFARMYLEHLLRVCGGQINRTSRQIGLNKVSLTEKIRKHAINWKTLRRLGEFSIHGGVDIHGIGLQPMHLANSRPLKRVVIKAPSFCSRGVRLKLLS